MEDGKGISLWLEPAEPQRARLHQTIAALAQQHRCPAFPPHVTVVSLTEIEDETLAAEMAAELAGATHPFPLTFTAVRMEDVCFRSLYLAAERTGELDDVIARARKTFGTPSGPPPHLSLMYTDLDRAARKAIASALPLELPLQTVASRLSLWRTTGPVRAWRQIARYSLRDRRLAWR